jgi:hypothetical protein
MTAPAPTVVYDNTTNDNRETVGTGPDGATGNQVTLSGSARVGARASLPHPAWSEEIVGQILEGVINDAGGLVLVGGHIVRVPPREPVEAILAALPAQLAQRLRPLVEAKPQGNLPQSALRQRLSRAIAQYQAQSRG